MKIIGNLKGSISRLFWSKTDKAFNKVPDFVINDQDVEKRTELEKAIELCAPLAAAYAELFRLSERLRKDEISSNVYLKKYDLLIKRVAVFYQDKNAFLKFVGAAASIEDFTK